MRSDRIELPNHPSERTQSLHGELYHKKAILFTPFANKNTRGAIISARKGYRFRLPAVSYLKSVADEMEQIIRRDKRTIGLFL